MVDDKIASADSKVLAAYVVAYRSVGINKDFALGCMEELMRRKAAGDEYDFESFIDEEVAKIPKPQGTDYADIIRKMQKGVSNPNG